MHQYVIEAVLYTFYVVLTSCSKRCLFCSFVTSVSLIVADEPVDSEVLVTACTFFGLFRAFLGFFRLLRAFAGFFGLFRAFSGFLCSTCWLGMGDIFLFPSYQISSSL